jgi:uncharacterized protein (DUF2267 family)
MPVPAEYGRATDEFYKFLVDARDLAELWSTHVTYTMTQGVFQVFRSRISIKEALAFANILPVGLRALFVADWDTQEPIKSFEDRESLTKEVKALRKEHNFSTDNAIEVIAKSLRKHVDEAALDKVLEGFSIEAREFWKV